MINIEITSQNAFMQHLLKKDTFDEYILTSAIIKREVSLTLENSAGEGDTEPLYKDYRAIIYDFIKGSVAPKYMKLVLKSKDNPKNVSGRFINIIYKDGTMSLTTGIAYETFVLDKESEREWDDYINRFIALLF